MFQAYHAVTTAQHQAHFDTLSAQGYRMISLSVYGEPGDARYAAVWVKRAGPGWLAVHGVEAAGYQSFFNNATAKGYAPVLVSATGAGSRAVFAAVFEQGVVGTWTARHNVPSGSDNNAGTFQNLNKTALANKHILRSVAIYGTPSDRRYAAVWHANPSYVKWHAHPSDTSESYQAAFNAETQLPGFTLHGYRPAYVALSGDHTYCSLFKDDVVGEWVAQHGLGASDYQREFDKQNARGLYPICLQGGGAGADTRYAAIFARQDIPAARQWSVAGTEVPTLAGLDHVMQAFMQANGVRAAQLAVAKNGTFKLSRAYTWAEAGYRATRVSDRFLLASCSKMFLEAAVQSLYDARKLQPGTAVYPLLGFSGPKDPRSDAITVQQLLDHQGGYDDTNTGSRFDPTYNMRKIANDLGLDRPVNKLDVARYMYARPLDFAPGSNTKYSNFGYLLAGAVVERVTGLAYFDHVRRTLLQPAGIAEVTVVPTRAAGRTGDMAIVEDQGLGLDPLDVHSPLLVPAVYGGDGEINEVGDPNDGLGASAQALVQFIHLHAVWGNGPRAANFARAGSTPGASSFAQSRGDGVDWAFTINTRDWPNATSPTLDDLPGQINHLLDSVHP